MDAADAIDFFYANKPKLVWRMSKAKFDDIRKSSDENGLGLIGDGEVLLGATVEFVDSDEFYIATEGVSQRHLNFHEQLDMLIRAQYELHGIKILQVKCEWVSRNAVGITRADLLSKLTVESATENV